MILLQALSLRCLLVVQLDVQLLEFHSHNKTSENNYVLFVSFVAHYAHVPSSNSYNMQATITNFLSVMLWTLTWERKRYFLRNKKSWLTQKYTWEYKLHKYPQVLNNYCFFQKQCFACVWMGISLFWNFLFPPHLLSTLQNFNNIVVFKSQRFYYRMKGSANCFRSIELSPSSIRLMLIWGENSLIPPTFFNV